MNTRGVNLRGCRRAAERRPGPHAVTKLELINIVNISIVNSRFEDVLYEEEEVEHDVEEEEEEKEVAMEDFLY